MFANEAHQCIPAEAVADVLDRASSDPVRARAESCPRCRTLMRSYAQFASATDIPGAELGQARVRLDAWIVSTAGGAAVESTQPSFRTAPRSFVKAWLRPARLIPVAALLVAVSALLWNRNPEVSMLRAPASDSAAAGFGLLTPEPATGSVRLSWRAHPQADAYEIIFYDQNLDEVYRATSNDVTLVLNRADLPPAVVSGSPLTYRVRALHLGDPVATADPGSVDAP